MNNCECDCRCLPRRLGPTPTDQERWAKEGEVGLDEIIARAIELTKEARERELQGEILPQGFLDFRMR